MFNMGLMDYYCDFYRMEKAWWNTAMWNEAPKWQGQSCKRRNNEQSRLESKIKRVAKRRARKKAAKKCKRV